MVGNLTFPTQKAATEHFRAILRRHAVGTRITQPGATELQWLLERHPYAGQKIGCGVAYFTTGYAANYGTVHFVLVRTDGSQTDFSFRHCIKAPTALADAKQAMRAEVDPDIAAAKAEFFRKNATHEGKVLCPISNAWIGPEGADADHALPYPFDVLVTTFLTMNGIVPDERFVDDHGDNLIGPVMRDRALAEEWRQFHHKMAVIRVIAHVPHQALSNKSKIRKADRQLDLTAARGKCRDLFDN
jgi:hypothetical protein